jgi:hypothetical protein
MSTQTMDFGQPFPVIYKSNMVYKLRNSSHVSFLKSALARQCSLFHPHTAWEATWASPHYVLNEPFRLATEAHHRGLDAASYNQDEAQLSS